MRLVKLEPGLVRNYRTGRPWIERNMEALAAAGWSRARLFRAGRFNYPFGPWGLAWSAWWTDKRLQSVEVEPAGTVAFHILEGCGRLNILRSRP